VFFGRFIPGLRTWASWLAGATHMRWRTFFLWNALGGICWATGIGLLAYFLGRSAGNLITTFGLFGLAAVLVVAAGAFAWHRRQAHHAPAAAPATGEPQAGDERRTQGAIVEPTASASEAPKG
jgi:phosphatidylglycerol lysyltransferase